ncbi:hypothetical protein [Dyella sp. 2HG41-7]|uniref:hypothetical protein n=1 Tax=Dyella sp. 2HG41-7 TaxID=2883239 RepID=UPI001F18942B|nr:hypothetical protein [Dyella sp. 2HG41-7]
MTTEVLGLSDKQLAILRGVVEFLRNLATMFAFSTGAAYFIVRQPFHALHGVVSYVIGGILYLLAQIGISCAFFTFVNIMLTNSSWSPRQLRWANRIVFWTAEVLCQIPLFAFLSFKGQ